MDSEIINQLARGAIPPGVFGVLAFGALWWTARPTARPEPESEGGRLAMIRLIALSEGWRLLLTPVLFTIAYIPTHLLVLGRQWPPHAAFDWLPVIAVVALAMALLWRAPRLPVAGRWAVVAVGLAVIGWMSSANQIKNSWGAGRTAAHLGGFVLVGLAAAWAMVRVSAGVTAVSPKPEGEGQAKDVSVAGWAGGVARGPVPVLLVLVPVMTASQLLVLGYESLRLGQAVGVAVAVLSGALIVSLWRRGLRLGVGGVLWPMVMAMACLYQGVLSDGRGITKAYPLLVAASPFAVLIARRVMGAKMKPSVRTAIELAAATLPAAAAMALAFANRTPPADY